MFRNWQSLLCQLSLKALKTQQSLHAINSALSSCLQIDPRLTIIALVQGCMFRQSVRQAMKAITVELERMQCALITASDTQRVAAQVASVTQLIAEVIHKVHMVSAWSLRLLCNSCYKQTVSDTLYQTSISKQGVDWTGLGMDFVLGHGHCNQNTCIISRFSQVDEQGRTAKCAFD